MSSDDTDKWHLLPERYRSVVEPFLGGIAAVITVVISNPVEVVKTRLQLQELKASKDTVGAQSIKYRGLAHGLVKILREEGVKGIQSGLVASMFSQATMNGFRYGCFKPCKEYVMKPFTSSICFYDMSAFDYKLVPSKTTTEDLGASFLSGAFGGIAGNPFNRLKAILQSDSTTSAGTPLARQSTLSAFVSIYKTEGIRGYLKGVGPATVRNGVAGCSQLGAYSFVKRRVAEEYGGRYTALQEGSILLHAIASLAAGISITTALNPLLYSDDQRKRFNSAYECARETLRTEGPMGFWKGYTASYMRLGPQTFFCFIIWEKLKETI
eukprot:Nk52_evm48s1810 gene=Nk52_evmTU48s1810